MVRKIILRQLCKMFASYVVAGVSRVDVGSVAPAMLEDAKEYGTEYTTENNIAQFLQSHSGVIWL